MKDNLLVKVPCLVLAIIVIVLFVQHIACYFFLFDDYCVVGLAQTQRVRQILDQALIGFYRPLGFLLLKVQHTLFGWGRPRLYVVVSLTLHIFNALLLGLVAKRILRQSPDVLVVAPIVFLASPWAGETYFWLSGQFDLLATTWTLLALFFALSWVAGRGSALTQSMCFAVMVISAVSGLLSKEGCVVVPALFLVLALYSRTAREIAGCWRFWVALAGLVLSAILYLGVRSRYLPMFGGAYGEYFRMLGRGTPWNLARAFVFVPGDRSDSPLYWGGHVVAALFVAMVISTAFRNDLRRSTLTLAGLAVSLIPVINLPVEPNSTAGGRFLYLPGVFVVLLLSMGLVRLFDGAGRVRSALVAAVLVLFLSHMAVSLHYQGRVWNRATSIARTCIEQFGESIGSGTHFYVTNLPFRFVQGPYVMKSYGFGFYYQRGDIRVRADRIVLSYQNGEVREAGRARDPFSQYHERRDEIALTMQY